MANSKCGQVLLLSPPQSYPLPLLSLTTHLALLSTRLPRLKSEGNEDPAFDDDWDASQYLYTRAQIKSHHTIVAQRPPVTLLVIAVGENVIFDPSRAEIAVAEAIIAVTVGDERNEDSPDRNGIRSLRLLSIRTIDPPSRLTQPGIAQDSKTATNGGSSEPAEQPETRDADVSGVWKPLRGGIKTSIILHMAKMILREGGVGEDVLNGLEGVEMG